MNIPPLQPEVHSEDSLLFQLNAL